LKGRVLITGGAGFLGLALGKHLDAHDYEVELVDNFSRGVNDRELISALESPRLTLTDLDLLTEDSPEKLGRDYDYVFHLAAIIGVVHVLKRPYEVLTQNVALLSRVLTHCMKQNRLKRLLFASTSEVYAGTLQHFELPIPTPEDVALAVSPLRDARTSYMLSKIYGEAMCLQSGLPVTIFRPHNIYGPRMGMAHIIPEQLKKASVAPDGAVVPVPSAEHRRCFLYVDDAVEYLRKLMENSNAEGSTVNLGQDGEEVTVEQVARICWSTVGKDLSMVREDATPGSPIRRVPDTRTLLSLTDYCPRIQLRDGVERTHDWYHDHIFSDRDVSAR